MKIKLGPRILNIIRTPTPLALWVSVLLLAVIAGGLWYFKKGNAPVAPTTKSPVIVSTYEEPRPAFAVVIDWSPDARPVSGLNAASLVFEMPVEPPIGRLLAFFPADAVADEIGPVRSARPYFLDFVKEFDAVFAHVGGSPDALAAIARSQIKDLNEYSFGRYFWRSAKKAKPHNVYTSIELLKEASGRFSVTTSTSATWLYKNAPTTEAKIHDVFLVDTPRGQWSYATETNDYYREGAREVRAKNIAVMMTDVSTIDGVGRQAVRTLGTGDAKVYLDGTLIDATWKKPSAAERLRFFRKDGGEIEWNPGLIWIVVAAQ